MEQWATINNFKNVKDGEYQISSYGSVRSTVTGAKLHKKIANKRKHPYHAVYLHLKDGSGSWILVHQLVATFFCEKPQVEIGVELVPDHLDNNGLNNHYKNLEWKTRAENTIASIERGEIDNNCENGRDAIIKNEEAHKICKYLEKGLSYDEILEKLDYPNTMKYRTLLVRIKNRIAWTKISKDYSFDSNERRYPKSQETAIKNINIIRKLIDSGFSNSEIVSIIWGPSCEKRKSKMETVRKIRRKEIFTEIA